jgi:hypothetical protein
MFGQLEQQILDNILNLPIGKPRSVIAQQSRIHGFEGYGGPGTFLYAYDAVNAADQIWIA